MINNKLSEVAEIFDISPRITEKWAVFPGDQKFESQVSMSFQNGNHIHLSSFNTTAHIGAHADAPSHYAAEGSDISGAKINIYLGPAQVITVPNEKRKRITVSDITHERIHAPRVLFRTNSFNDYNTWTDDFMALSGELIEYLHNNGVVLVGIDTPSVDISDSKELPSHKMLFQTQMAVLEGLYMPQVLDGLYMLSALPLALVGLEASPVRAILYR